MAMGRASPTYEICSSCHLTTYSAGLLSLVGEQCPRCGERLAKSSTARNTPGARPGLATLGARSRLSSST